MGSLLHILKTNISMLSNAKPLLWLTYFNIIPSRDAVESNEVTGHWESLNVCSFLYLYTGRFAMRNH